MREGCPRYEALRLGLFQLTTTLTRPPVTEPPLPAAAYARLLASTLSTAIAQLRPGLLALVNEAARPAWERDESDVLLQPGTSGQIAGLAGPEGHISLAFVFDGL